MGNKKVLICGASGDLGYSIAQKLLSSNYELVLHYFQNEARIQELKDGFPNQILQTLKADFRDESSVQQLLEKLSVTPEGVVFANGISYEKLFQDSSLQVMDDLYKIHLKGPWIVLQSLMPHMIRKQAGNIIFISSVWGEVGASFETIYSSFKGAQNAFTRALSKEVGKSNIRVNSIAPGWIETKMNAHLQDYEKEVAEDSISLGRIGSTEEVSNVVKFLISEESQYIHGQILKVDGGWT
ncbi:SDR family oxidoreductase [Bacillaceae bacterium S4-13-58]